MADNVMIQYLQHCGASDENIKVYNDVIARTQRLNAIASSSLKVELDDVLYRKEKLDERRYKESRGWKDHTMADLTLRAKLRKKLEERNTMKSK